jgi:hypothetical protein
MRIFQGESVEKIKTPPPAPYLVARIKKEQSYTFTPSLSLHSLF